MFGKHVLDLDAPAAIEAIGRSIREALGVRLKRRGVVVAMSGGIDSSVVAGLCVRALGPERVIGLFLPENDSSPDSLTFGKEVAEAFGITAETVVIGPALEALGCYRSRDEAVRAAVPAFGPGWKCKLVLPPMDESGRLNVFYVVAQSPSGEVIRERLPLDAYLQLVAASNMKQRTRKLIEYYHAERRNYAVTGTPNRLEYDQGFFVKGGDGLADLKPIAHLYKTQVYALAEALGVPENVRRRPPTTDTYSLPQSQEEFYFALPYDKMDLCLWAHNHGIPAEEAGPVVGLSPAQVHGVYRDIESKRRTTRYLHLAPLLMEPVLEIEAGYVGAQGS